jgi:hypothetical protein
VDTDSEGGDGLENLLESLSGPDPFKLLQRKTKGLKEEDFPKLERTPAGEDLEVLNAIFARFQTLDLGAEMPWLITYEQLGATISMAKQLLGAKCWQQIYAENEHVHASDPVPRNLVALIGLRIEVARKAHLVIVASDAAMELARKAVEEAEMAMCEEEGGWTVKRGKKPRRDEPYATPAAATA